jgi:multidrug/hemolysin transport system ATP-binding protein
VVGLRKSYGEVRAVDGVEFSVRPGQAFAFLGPNGAGKSTTINMLCTLLRPDAGRILVDGVDVAADPDAVKRRIGIVFQESVLDDELTVRENLRVRAGAYLSSRSEIAAAIGRVSEITALGEFLDRRYGRLSGGQRRRADIARALLHTPKVLFLDEPTTGLDPQTRRHVWDTVRRISRETGMTVFLTTHYMEEAAQCDHVVIVDGGKVVAQGSPEDLRARHTTEQLRITAKDPDAFTATLAGLPDLGPGRVRRDGAIHVVRLESTIDAIGLLHRLAAEIASFEVLQGTMDDVFLTITGREIRDHA